MPPQSNEELNRELYAGLQVLTSQQKEINRRLGIIEKVLKEEVATSSRVSDIESELEATSTKRSEWVSEIIRILVNAVVITCAYAVAFKLFGVELKW